MGCGAVSGTQDVLQPQLQFRKLKSITKNQSSEIWTCQNQNNQKFSIKVFKKIYINHQNESMLKNFQQQINRLYGLTDTNIHKKGNSQVGKHLMPYFRAWKDQNGNLSLIMKYIQQSSMGDEVKGKLPGLFSQQQISKFTQQILQTIKYLRKNTSIFCNIKPTNIFLDKKRQNIILTDYYNLEEYFNLTQTNIFNNPVYSAPENVLFNQYFQQTDIWRVGCFIVEMLTCIKPWYKQTISNEKIIQNLKNMQKPPLPQKISITCKNFLQKCFETDHNRRISLQELLNHQFLSQNFLKTQSLPQVDNQNKYERQNTQAEQIASYNFEVQIIQQTPRKQRNLKRIQTQRAKLEQLSSKQKTLKFKVPRKKATSNYLSAKTYETSNVIISQNDENYEQSIIDMKKSKKFRSKRIKTQGTEKNYIQNSPYMKRNNQKQIISLFHKKKNSNNIGHSLQMTNQKDLLMSKKISRTSDYRISGSKKKIPTNQITLNNQVLNLNQNSSTKYWPVPQTPTPYDCLDTAQKLTKVMKEIQISGGPKYYKKPLKLLKQKMRDKTSLRTQTSLTFEDSQTLQQRSIQDIEQIDFQVSNNMTSQDYPNQSQVSKISLYPAYENRVIETMVSKAYKDRLQTQQKMLKEQRQKDKVKWQKQLQQGRQFIKNQINRRYYSINKRIQKNSNNSQHF